MIFFFDFWLQLFYALRGVFIFSHFITEYVVPGAIPVCASVCLCVCLSVCLYAPFIWTLLDRCWWNLDHMILSKIWDETFLRFWKCYLDDVITAILMLFDGALSRLQFLCNFLQIHICCSSTHGFVWDCNPAFLVHIFYPKWRLEKQLKIKT